MTLKMFEIIIGAVVILAALFCGILRIVKVPKGLNFSTAAVIRYVVFTGIALSGGIALLTIGLIQ